MASWQIQAMKTGLNFFFFCGACDITVRSPVRTRNQPMFLRLRQRRSSRDLFLYIGDTTNLLSENLSDRAARS